MKPIYQVWKHRATGELYAVRLEWDAARRHLIPTGVCGPTDANTTAGDGEDGWYQTGCPLQDLQERREEFVILPPRFSGLAE